MDKPNFVYVTYIQTTAERLWKALTHPEFTRQYWFGITFDTDWRVGSRFQATQSDGTKNISGEVLEVDPPRRLSYTFKAEKGAAAADPASRVVLELVTLEQLVKLTVTHDRLTPVGLASISNGWPMVLSGLKSLLETGAALATAIPPCAQANCEAEKEAEKKEKM